MDIYKRFLDFITPEEEALMMALNDQYGKDYFDGKRRHLYYGASRPELGPHLFTYMHPDLSPIEDRISLETNVRPNNVFICRWQAGETETPHIDRHAAKYSVWCDINMGEDATLYLTKGEQVIEVPFPRRCAIVLKPPVIQTWMHSSSSPRVQRYCAVWVEVDKSEHLRRKKWMVGRSF